MNRITDSLKELIIKLIQNQKAWLVVLAALFASSYTVDNHVQEIIAALISLWAMVLIGLFRSK